MEDFTRFQLSKQIASHRNADTELYGGALGPATFHHAELVRLAR